MGKTLKAIIGGFQIAAGIIFETIPGGQIIGTALIASGLAIEASILFAPKSPNPPGAEVTQRIPIPPRQSAYGARRLYGAYILYDTAKDGSAVDVWAYHDGRINHVIDHFIGDKKVTILGNGFVQHVEDDLFGSNDDVVQAGNTLGQNPSTAFPVVIAAVPDHWTSDHRGDGVVTGYMVTRPVKAKGFQTTFSTGGPNQTPLSIAAECQLVFDWRDSSQSVTDPTTWRYSENFILHLAHYLIVRMGRSWSLHFVPTLAYWTAAANDADIDVPLKGVQTILAGEAAIGAHTINIYSTNGLHAGMTVKIYVGGNNAQTETRTVTSISGAFVSFSGGGLTYKHPQGSQVTWDSDPTNPATEKRYRSCVLHAHTDAHKDILTHILACGDGWLSPRSDGALVVYSGRFTEPTVTIGPDEIVSYSYQEGVAEEDAINTVKLSYISQPHDFSTVDTDDWTDEDDIEARGKVLSDSLENQVPSHAQARRLAKRAIAKLMAPYRGTITTTSAGRIAIGQRFVHVQLIEAGTTFYDGPAEVTKMTRNLQTGGVTFDWVAADPNADVWDPATEEGDPAPVGNRIALQSLEPPTITGATPDFASIADDGTGVRIAITAAGLDRSDVTWFARWRVQGAAVWNEQTYDDVDTGPAVELLTSFVPTGHTIEVEAAYQTGDGRLSTYSTHTLVDTSTDQTAPDAATAITLDAWTGTMSLSTPAIARAAAYRWRFYKADGTTFIASHDSAGRNYNYTSAQAASDGIERAYVVKVSGVNSAGEGTAVMSSVLSKPAPAAVTGVTATGGATSGEIDFTLSTDPNVAGYATFYSTVSGFDPMTQGAASTSGSSPAYLQNLSAGTFYAKVAAYDAWAQRPNLLNLSGQVSFVITTGGGGVGSGGGGGGGGYGGGGGHLNSY